MKKTRTHFSRSRLNQAIALALLTSAAMPAMAGSGSCSDGSNAISGAKTSTCYLEPGDSLNVDEEGSITDSSGTGVFVEGSNSITNAGTITGDMAGLYLYAGTIQGSVTNSGTIESTNYNGVYVYGDGGSVNVTGDFINSGNITALNNIGIYVYANTTLNIQGDFINSGTIEADTFGIYVYGYGDASMNIAGDLINSGTILSGDTSMYIYGAIGGDIVNSGTIISTNDTGIYIMNTGAAAKSITNSGTIIADDRGLAYSGSVTGNITNSGLIQSGSSDAGVYIFGGGLVGGNIVNSGTIDSDGYGLYAYTNVAGNIENSGLIKSDSSIGLFLFYSSNVGGSIINSGTIDADSHGMYIYADVAGNIENSGLIDSGGSGMYIYGSNITGSLINRGSIDAGGMGLYLYGSTFGSIDNSGTILADDYYGIYLYASSVSGDIVNSGTIDSGGGYPSIYVYDSTVTGEINNSGTLLGHIEINDGDVVNSGLIHTRDEPSYVEDDFSNTSGGTLRFNADNSTTFGYFDLDDTATFAAGSVISLDAQVGNTLDAGDVLNGVIEAGTLVASTFTVTDNLLALSFNATINGDNVDLTAVDTGLTTVDAAGVGGEAGAVIDDLMDLTSADYNADLAFAIGSASTVGELEEAVEGTMPALSGGVAQTSLDFITAFDNLVGDRQAGIASGDRTLANKNFWVKGYGSFADQDKRDGVSGYDVDSYGMAVGVDGELSSSWSVGAAASYSRSDVESKVTIGSHDIDVDTIFGKVYATHKLDSDTAVNLQAGLGFSDFDSKRLVAGGAVASAGYDAKHFRASAEWVRMYQRSADTTVSPYVRAEYRYVDVDGYTESGAGGLNLDVSDDSADSLILGVGVRGSHTTSNNWVLTGDVGIGYDAMTDESSLTASFQGGGAQFSVDGMEPSKVVYNLGLGAKYELDNGTEIRAGYDLNGRKDFTDQSLSVKARWKF